MLQLLLQQKTALVAPLLISDREWTPRGVFACHIIHQLLRVAAQNTHTQTCPGKPNYESAHVTVLCCRGTACCTHNCTALA